MEDFEKVVTTDLNNHLEEVYKASYSLIPKSKLEIMQIADRVNKKVGFELFKDLYYPTLICEFSIITRMAQDNALKSK